MLNKSIIHVSNSLIQN